MYSKKSETSQEQLRRVCRMGCGIELAAGTGLTPGYTTREKPVIVRDLRGFNRLDMTRESRDVRTIQTSLWLSQGWRANCDIQVLLYDSDPDFPDASDIAKVTDYIVAYACKGNETISEEKNQIAALIHSEKENYGTSHDVTRLARRILNKATGQKMISKQEAIVQGAGLKLFDCSERIETISLSSSYRIGRESGYDSKTIIMQYSKRQQRFSGLSLHEYFMYTKNYNNCNSRLMTIPHYVGASTQPTFPPTEAYAKSMLMIHSPWQNKFDIENRDFVSEFTLFLSSPLCPDIVKIPFNRVCQRVLAKTTYVEPTTSERKERYEDFTEAPDDLRECIQLASTLASNAATTFSNSDESMDFGESYDWSSKKLLVRQIDCWHHFVLLFQFLNSVTG